MPCFIVKNDWFTLGGKRKPGVWYCYQTTGTAKKPPTQTALRISSPLYVNGITNTEDGRFYGRLLRFRDTLGHWRNWAMPMELLRGSCEELRGELLAAGMEIEQRHRARLAEYLQFETPKEVVTAAIRTGWTAKGGAFVLHDRIIGAEKVHFQSETLSAEGAAKTGGDYHQWQTMAALCEGNPVLMVSVCVSLSGPLLVKVHRDSGGVHWLGDSSIGKTTALCVGASVWGGKDFQRTWRATSNGLEGVAALLSDTCLCLDEINEVDPREVGAIVYSLANGIGKSRATRIGSARQVHRWRLSLLSTGERSVTAMMQEGGKQAKAGQGSWCDCLTSRQRVSLAYLMTCTALRMAGRWQTTLKPSAASITAMRALNLSSISSTKAMLILAQYWHRSNRNLIILTLKRRGRLHVSLYMRWRANWRLRQESCHGRRARHWMPAN